MRGCPRCCKDAKRVWRTARSETINSALPVACISDTNHSLNVSIAPCSYDICGETVIVFSAGELDKEQAAE